jgi:hypothetical protein
MFFEFATLAGDQEFAGTCIGIAETTAARNAGVASFEGVALNLRGRSRKDLDMIAQSAAVLALSPRPILRGLGADTYGRALLADGQRPAGLAQLDRAWDEYHQMGAWAARADVQRAMHQAGVRRANWAVTEKPAAGWPSLTEAERRVAELIGSGHTNKSAAAELPCPSTPSGRIFAPSSPNSASSQGFNSPTSCTSSRRRPGSWSDGSSHWRPEEPTRAPARARAPGPGPGHAFG